MDLSAYCAPILTKKQEIFPLFLLKIRATGADKGVMANMAKTLWRLTRVRIAVLILAFGFGPFALLTMAMNAIQR